MSRVDTVLRGLTVVGLLLGVMFMIAPVNADVTPLDWPKSGETVTVPTMSRSNADSLTEDIILYNLFAPSRTAPSRRYASTEGGSNGMDDPGPPPTSNGFSPELVGTAVSERAGETRALLRLSASEPGPRLYAVGEKAGGYTVVSIDARSVVLAGPKGRVVLRLPDNEESHS